MARSRLSVCAGLAVALVGFFGLWVHEARTQDTPPGASKLEGAWRLISSKNGEAAEQTKTPEGVEQVKLVIGGRFIWTVVQDGKLVAGAGGTYTVKGDTFTEHVAFVSSENVEVLRGKDFSFTWKIEDGKWHHTGTLKLGDSDVKIDEIYERCK